MLAFVVGVVLARLGDDLAVQRVLDTALDQHGHGLGALVADHLADQGARFSDLASSVAHLAARLLLARMVLPRRCHGGCA